MKHIATTFESYQRGILSGFVVGDTVKVEPENDNENYDDFRHKKLIITKVSTDETQHPGFDATMKDEEALYDLKTEDGEEIQVSLYDYELVDWED